MAEQKEADLVFDPRAPQFRRKLWVHVQTTNGRRLIVIWPRVGALLAVLFILAWLALGTAVWGFVRYQRGVEAVRWVDIAFYPVRKAAYRTTLGRHYLALGKAQLDQRKWMEGALNLRAAVAYAPELTEARGILAEFHLMTNRPEMAIRVMEEGLPYAKRDEAYVQRLFHLYEQLRKPERAVQTAAKFLPVVPEPTAPNFRVALATASALVRLHRLDESEVMIGRWRLDETVEGQLLLAELSLARNEFEPAVQRLEGLLAKKPDNEAVALQLTRLYLQQQRKLDARRVTLIRSISQPNSPGARIDLLNLDLELGRRDEFDLGVDDFLKNFYSDPAALQLLAKVAAEQALPDLAERLLAVVRRAGHDPRVFLLGLIHAQCAAGRFPEAVATARDIDREDGLGERSGTSLMAFKCWAYYGVGNQAEGNAWLHRFISQQDIAIGDALGLAANLEKMSAPAAAGKVLAAAAERPGAGSAPLISLAGLLVRQQDWVQAKTLLPRLKALADPPHEAIGAIEANAALLGL